MACAIVEDRQRTLDPTTAVERRDRSGNLIGPNLELVGKKTWYERFLSHLLRPLGVVVFGRLAAE